MNEELRSVYESRHPLQGNVAGVYFLFHGDELLYVGTSWNCFLGAAEQTRKDSGKRFTSWSFIQIDDEEARHAEKARLIQEHTPRFNR